MSDDREVYKRYRLVTPQGDKEWAIATSDAQGILIRAGEAGGPVRLESIRVPDAKRDMYERIAGQRAKGFVYVGRAKINRGRFQPVPEAEPITYWRMREHVSREALHPVLREAYRRLVDGGLQNEVAFDEAHCVLVIRSSINAAWEIGFSVAGGFGQLKCAAGLISDELQGVLPLLIMVFLQSHFPQLTLIRNDQPVFASLSATCPIVGGERFSAQDVEKYGSLLGLCFPLNRWRSIAQMAGPKNLWF